MFTAPKGLNDGLKEVKTFFTNIMSCSLIWEWDDFDM